MDQTTAPQLTHIASLSVEMRLPIAFLAHRADRGEIPGLRIAKVWHFDPVAVRRALVGLASEPQSDRYVPRELVTLAQAAPFLDAQCAGGSLKAEIEAARLPHFTAARRVYVDPFLIAAILEYRKHAARGRDPNEVIAAQDQRVKRASRAHQLARKDWTPPRLDAMRTRTTPPATPRDPA